MTALPLVLFFLGGFPWVTGQAMVGSAAGVLVRQTSKPPLAVYSVAQFWGFLLGP